MYPLHMKLLDARNDDQLHKFKSLTVNYNELYFKCLELENFDGVIYIKFSTILCNPSNFSTLAAYRENNSSIEQFVGYIVYLAITKYIGLMLDFKEDSISEATIEISLQSIGFGNKTY